MVIGECGTATDRHLERRIDTLRDCLDRQLGLVERTVTLKRAQRTLRILTPSPEAIERLFSEAPRHLQPFWTRVWPSGIALADMAFSWQDDLCGQRVLELGCGLGVTAAATTQIGATVVAVDFAPAALAYCRLNTLINTGRGVRTLPPLDWRAPTQRASASLQASGEFSIIMAADVLYESGDIVPLMQLIDHVLTPDGTLLLAEPGRETAQRFLYRMAEDGWHGVSETVEVLWEDDATEYVNVHVLRRPSTTDWFRSSLGGWRV